MARELSCNSSGNASLRRLVVADVLVSYRRQIAMWTDIKHWYACRTGFPQAVENTNPMNCESVWE